MCNANSHYNWDIILSNNTCYTFTIFDSYGDGICCLQGSGSYTISYNNIVATGGQFNHSETVANICTSSLLVGCTDPSAQNFDYNADTNIALGGIIDPLDSSLSGGHFNGNQHLYLDAIIPSNILSADVYIDHANSVTFELRDNNSNVIDDTTVSLVAGLQRVELNFEVPIGNDYELGISAPHSGLYRNNNGVSYPYDIGGLINITGYSAGGSYYYFF